MQPGEPAVSESERALYRQRRRREAWTQTARGLGIIVGMFAAAILLGWQIGKL